MATETKSLEQLGALTGIQTPAAEAAPTHVRKIDKLGRSYATGKRKNAVARVWVKAGQGRISVNGKEADKYFLPFKLACETESSRLMEIALDYVQKLVAQTLAH